MGCAKTAVKPSPCNGLLWVPSAERTTNRVLGGCRKCIREELGSSRLPAVFSKALQQLEHLAVEFIAAKIFVVHVTAAAVEHAEAAAQVPQRPAPSRFLPQFQAVPHPGQHD